jgi:hypothetical protein
MATSTTNYGFSKPAATDTTVVRTTYGTALDAVDTALKTVASAVDEAFRPTGAIAETTPRRGNFGSCSIVNSGMELVAAVYLPVGAVITSITWCSSTAGSGLTHHWSTLRNSSRQLLAITDDDTTATWSANSTWTRSFASPYTVLASGLYYVGQLQVHSGGAVSQLLGAVHTTSTALQVAPKLGGYDATNTGLTTPATAPATNAAYSGQGGTPWAYVS